MLECISAIFRIGNVSPVFITKPSIDTEYDEESEELDERDVCCQQVISWFIENGIEKTAINLYTDASDIEKHVSALKLDSLTETEVSKRKSELIEQKLNEIASSLNLLFMIYYKRVKCDPQDFLDLLRKFMVCTCISNASYHNI